jgi:hypothetical protein
MVIYVFKKRDNLLKTMKSLPVIFFFITVYGENGLSWRGAGARIFDKLEPEPQKNGPAPQH